MLCASYVAPRVCALYTALYVISVINVLSSPCYVIEPLQESTLPPYDSYALNTSLSFSPFLQCYCGLNRYHVMFVLMSCICDTKTDQASCSNRKHTQIITVYTGYACVEATHFIVHKMFKFTNYR